MAENEDADDQPPFRGPRVRHRRSEIVKQLIHKHGSRDRALEELARENFKLREKIRQIANPPGATE
jgi:hypothetical protein